MGQNLSAQEIQFKKVMGVMAILFLITTLFFIMVPEQMIQTANFFGKIFKLPKAPVPKEIPAGNVWPTLYEGESPPAEQAALVMGRGYVALTCSLMTVLVVISLACFINPRKYMGWVPLVLVSKFASSAYGVLFFLTSAKYFGNVAIAITDFPIFLIILIFWLRARSAATAAA
jgi:hypothetical protein